MYVLVQQSMLYSVRRASPQHLLCTHFRHPAHQHNTEAPSNTASADATGEGMGQENRNWDTDQRVAEGALRAENYVDRLGERALRNPGSHGLRLLKKDLLRWRPVG